MLSKETLEFLADLKANNNRDWFLDNKKRYEIVKKDYHQLVGSFLDAMKPLDPSLEMLEVKNCTFRINRDVRFAKDASCYYLHIENGISFVGGGLYCPQPDQLQKIRKEIHFFYDDLVEIVNEEGFKSNYQNLNRDEKSTLKNPPKGYDKEDPAVEFLKLKSFTATQKFDSKLVTQKDFVPMMVEKMIALKPFNNFIDRALYTG
jgi:uncharacterized protein (DUF2461 family)